MTNKLEKKNPKVAVFSVIRRWDHYVPKTIDSVVAQTYENWEWYIFTSPDSQGDIENYVKDEPRIHLMANRNFHCHCEDMTKGEKLSCGIVETAQKGDYFCVIDGDDRMAEDFMEYQLGEMSKNNLDISACGVAYSDENGALLTETDNEITTDYNIAQKDFLSALPVFLIRYWTLWGKIFKSELITKDLFEDMPLLRASNDVSIAVPLLKRAKNIGLRKKIGYFYSIHQEGMSFQNFHLKREEEPFAVRKLVSEMLAAVSDGSAVSERKREYLSQCALIFHLVYTIKALLQSNRTQEDKLNLIHYLLNDQDSQGVFSLDQEFSEYLITVAPTDPFSVWSHKLYLNNMITLKLNFFLAFSQALPEGISEDLQGKMREIFFILAPECAGKVQYDTLAFLTSHSKLTYLYFNFDQEPPGINGTKLRQEIGKLTPSLATAEIGYLVGEKLQDASLLEETLAQKLKFYQEANLMDEMMAVMDEMIAKNIQF